MDNSFSSAFTPIKIEPIKIEPIIVPGAFSGCAHIQTLDEFRMWKAEQHHKDTMQWFERMKQYSGSQ